MLLRGVRFNSNISKKEEIGFISQEVAEHVPELITSVNGGYLGVHYDRMTALL
jgi:hypothetical protein